MKIRLTTWQLGLVLLLSVLIPALGMATLVGASNKAPLVHSTQHQTPGDFWDSVRLKPVTVTEIRGDTVYWKFEDKSQVILGSFQIEERTMLPKDFQEGKKYLVIYCDTHKVAYEFQDWREP